MKRLTSFKTMWILRALCYKNRKPLQRFMRELLADGKFRYWRDEEVLLLKAMESFLFENGYKQEAQDLIRTVGFEMLLDLPTSTFQTVLDVVQSGDESFAQEAFSAIEKSVVLNRLSEEESLLLLRAAEKAMELEKGAVALSIYRAALSYEAQLNTEKEHPLVIAAKTNNPILGQAYSEIYEKELKYVGYNSGYLEELVQLGETHYLSIALKCNANVLAPTSSGQSLLDIAPDEDTRLLLMHYGAKPTNNKVFLLRQGIDSIENGDVNHEIMQEIFSDADPLLEYSFFETRHPTTMRITWNLINTAAKYHSVPAFICMLPYLQKNCTDQMLDKLLSTLLGVDTFAGKSIDIQTANDIIAVLELFEAHGISYTYPWDWDYEEYRMTANYNSKVAKILNLVCYNIKGTSELPNEILARIAKLLWRIGRIRGAEAAREMLLLGINHQNRCLIDICLEDYDFSLLDTHKTSAVWNVVGNELGDEETTRDLLHFAIQNGADINHRTSDGLTALHAAYQYGGSDFSPVKLLIQAGADQQIRDRFGRKPKDMPKEKFVFLSGGKLWPR